MPVSVPTDAAALWITVRVVENGTSVLDQSGMARIGQPVQLFASTRADEAPVSISLWVQHYAARHDAFSIRLTLRRGAEILFAPVLLARPGQPARFEGDVDEQELRLTLTVDLAANVYPADPG